MKKTNRFIFLSDEELQKKAENAMKILKPKERKSKKKGKNPSDTKG